MPVICAVPHQHSVYATGKVELHVFVNVLYREFTYEVVQKKGNQR
jgi:hypothetical protein